MEIEELKKMWNVYDEKLDKSIQLNISLLRRMNFDKTAFRMRWLLVIKISVVCWLAFVIFYVTAFGIRYFSMPQFAIPAAVMILICLVSMVFKIKQLAIIVRLLARDNAEAVTPIQKMIERLKLLIAGSVRYELFLIPFYPVLMILIGKLFLNIDFFSPALKVYALVNILVGIFLLPAFIWTYLQLGKKNIRPGLIKKLLPGSGWFLANDAEGFLSEIEKFEQES